MGTGSSANKVAEEKKAERGVSQTLGEPQTENRKEEKSSTAMNSVGNSRQSGFKRLTNEEYQQKCEKGVCFLCDEKFALAHRCKNKQLHILLLFEEEEEELEQPEIDMLSQEEMKEGTMALSLNAMLGISDAKSMRLKGIAQVREITTLIDCGATHNFVSHKVFNKLGIKMEKGKRFTVQVGDGYELQSRGIYKGVTVQLQGITISQDFYPLKLGSASLILGMQWLESIGDINTNWRDLTMKFVHNGQRVCLQGDPTLTQIVVSLKSMIKNGKRRRGWNVATTKCIEGEG